MSIVSLHNAHLMVGGNLILDEVTWQIQPQDRIALVGRNGAGKSSLLKLLQGEYVLDAGSIQRISGLQISGLTQDVPVSAEESVYHYPVSGLGDVGELLAQYRVFSTCGQMEQLSRCQQEMDALHAWDLLPKIETMASRLDIPLDDRMLDLSGGMKRRVLLGATLLANPGLLLLDEPTNHLDMQSIEWLESYLKNYSGSVVVVTHDREFLSQVASQIVEIDRGKLHARQCSYETYLDRREAIRESESRHNDLFDKKLAQEEVWIRTGIKARRTRNEGRVRALKALREEYKARRKALGKMKSIHVDVNRPGAVVIEANDISYSIAERPLIKKLSLLLMRGDKLGVIGPNGCGKTTLVRLLLGDILPDAGEIKQGTGLQVAYFDQLRSQLCDDKTLLFNVGDGADYVTINGKQKLVASYLSDFLFPPARFNQPVSSLSGGERNRLLVAKLLAKPVNFLVMDEPTNDLDIESLELLETLLVNYPGTLILISHDRAFINQVVTSVLVYDGDGEFNEFLGGYDEYRVFKKQQQQKEVPVNKPIPVKAAGSTRKLSYNEQRELSQLPQQIEHLEKRIAELQSQMTDSGFYQQSQQTIADFGQTLAKEEALLDALFARWEALEGK